VISLKRVIIIPKMLLSCEHLSEVLQVLTSMTWLTDEFTYVNG
jgi:hypothetical protein